MDDDLEGDPQTAVFDAYVRGLVRRLREEQDRSGGSRRGLSPADLLYGDVTSAWVSPDEWDSNPSVRHERQNICLNLYRKNEIAKNIILNYLIFTYGRGVRFRVPEPEQAKTKARAKAYREAQEKLARFARINKLSELLRQAFEMTLVMGEWFLVEPANQDEEAVRKLGIIGLRPLDPRHVRQVILKGNDPLQPEAYRLTSSASGWGANSLIELPSEDAERKVFGHPRGLLPAERVHHFRINVSRVHGRPILEPVIPRILQVHEMLEDRVAISNMRSRIPLIRLIKGKRLRVPRELPPRRTVITGHLDRERWEMPNYNLEAPSTELEPLLEAIAQGVNLPTFLITMDYTQAGSYGQIPLATLHAQRVFEDVQEQLKPVLHELALRIVPWLEPEEVEVEFLRISLLAGAGGIGSQVQQFFQAQLISRRTAVERAAEVLGLDPEREWERLRREEEEIQQQSRSAASDLQDLAQGLGALGSESPTPTPAPTGAGAEAGAGMGGMSPPSPPSPEFELPPLPDLSQLASPTQQQQAGAGTVELVPTSSSSNGSRGRGKVEFTGGSGTIELIRRGRLLLEALRLTAPDPDSRGGRAGEVVLGMDFGYTEPGAVVVVEIAPEGHLLVVEEIVEPELPIDSPKGERSWASILHELAERYGASVVYTDPRDPEAVERLRAAVGHLLEVEPIAIGVEEGLSIVANLAAAGGLWVHRNCAILKDECRARAGHALDALRYALAGIVRDRSYAVSGPRSGRPAEHVPDRSGGKGKQREGCEIVRQRTRDRPDMHQGIELFERPCFSRCKCWHTLKPESRMVRMPAFAFASIRTFRQACIPACKHSRANNA